MAYQEALEAFGHRKVTEFGGNVVYNKMNVDVEMTQATHDTYWGDEAGEIYVTITYKYLHTLEKGKRAGKSEERNGFLSFTYDNPIDFLRELLGE